MIRGSPSVGVAVSGVAVYAVQADGYQAHTADLNDGGIWVTSNRDGSYGRINKPIGDKMIMNAAFLVSRDLENAFDAGVKSIASAHDKLTFKYTGPWPPYNFVNIRLKLERV